MRGRTAEEAIMLSKEKTMKMSRIFWGVFFAAAGVLLLLVKFGLVSLEIGDYWKFWPLILVVWGIGMIAGSRAMKIGAVAAVALVLALGLYEGARWWWSEDGRTMTSQEFTAPEDTSIASASFRFSSGAGKFTLADSCADLIRANTESRFGTYSFDTEEEGGSRSFAMRLEGGGRHPAGRGTHTAVIRLGTRPRWDLQFDIGAATLELDLRPFLVENLRVNGGAGSVRVTLGDRAQECAVNVSAGVSSIRIRVPELAGCELHIDAPLSSTSIEGFTHTGAGRYATEDFDAAERKITLKIAAGVSKIRVERY
jgi:hypothetical protein